jgi:hypothetical protein
MNSDVKDRNIRNLQSETIDDLAKNLKTIHKIASGYNEYARKNNWKENRAMKEVETESLRGLQKLDWHGATLELLKRAIPKEQKKLVV